MDLKSFASDFMANIDVAVELDNANQEEELTNAIIEYIVDSGEVNAPEICNFRKTKAALHAYDYNVDGNSLDLFILIQTDTLLGKVNSSKVSNGFNKLSQIYRESMDGTILKSASINDEMREVAELIQSTKGEIDTLRFFVLTNGLIESTYSPSTVELDNGLIMEQNIWDMQRIYQQDCFRTGKEKIEIDFPTIYNTELQCLKMSTNNPDVDGYLAIIPGITLAQIYKEYKQALLEKNVRTFLQFKAKVNRGIRETLREQPDMFFSYNNGISTTATDIELKEHDGALYITRLIDWQIVNGGQTTASIAATYTEKGADLSKVYVPMKISVIKDSAKVDDIVPQISKNANSQTAVKQSDFSANDPYLVDLENLSRQTWVPNGKAKSTTKWYFERTRGQYLDEMGHLSGFNERLFRESYPKIHKIGKTDIAKYVMCWDQHPESVCKGAEKNYLAFVKEIKAKTPVVSEVYYKRLIAKAILYKTIDTMVRNKKLGGYKSNMDAYILAAVSFISRKHLNLDEIWEIQSVPSALVKIIDNLIPVVWKHITEPSQRSNAQSVNVNEWTKRAECWNSLKLQLDGIELPEELKLAPEDMLDDSITVAQQSIIDQAWAVAPETWFAASKFAKENDLLTPIQRKMAFSFGRQRSWNKILSLKQAMAGMKILQILSENGFEER